MRPCLNMSVLTAGGWRAGDLAGYTRLLGLMTRCDQAELGCHSSGEVVASLSTPGPARRSCHSSGEEEAAVVSLPPPPTRPVL